MEWLNGEGLLLPVLWSVGYSVKHKTKIPNTYIPFILFAVASALKYLEDLLAALIFGEAASLSTLLRAMAYGIEYTFFACGGYETVRAARFTWQQRRKKENHMDLRKKPFLIFLIAFIVASAVFFGISLIFGSGFFGAFAKITDGWVFGVLLLMAYDTIRKVIFEREKITTTYIFMQVLLFINVCSFAYASVTANRTFSIVGLSVSVFTGALAGLLPGIVAFGKAQRAGNPADGKALNEAFLQHEWAKFRNKVMKLDPERRAGAIEQFLAFKLIGDNIYGGLDLNRPLLVGMDGEKTVAITVARATGEQDFGVSAGDIEVARGYIASLVKKGGK